MEVSDTGVVWHTEPDGTLAAEISGFRLVIQVVDRVSGRVRFLVLRCGEKEQADSLIGSGCKDDVGAAMTTAEEMARRCAERSAA